VGRFVGLKKSYGLLGVGLKRFGVELYVFDKNFDRSEADSGFLGKHQISTLENAAPNFKS
jgi:hypothetical protein